MKEFEKWLDKKSYSQAEERIAEATWIAALKWAKGKVDYANATNDMIDWIFEEELDAKT